MSAAESSSTEPAPPSPTAEAAPAGPAAAPSRRPRGPGAERPALRRVRRLAVALAVLAAAWIAFAEATLLRPPRGLPAAPAHRLTRAPDGTLRYGRSYLRRRGGVWEMGLAGNPVELGDAHARLARDAMFRVEDRMMGLFAHYVPTAFLRGTITTLVRAQHRHLDRNFPAERLTEIAAEARALAADDPYATFLPTYHRLVTLHALYDISLSFEHSPLLGCSAFFASGTHTRDGHTYVGRNFDMEVDDVFDTEKTVDLYRPDGAIPFASVAWPGLTGVVTGMNLEGIFVAVHGARASAATTTGVPVPTTVRTVMERARDLDEAVRIVRADAPMVSHMLLVVDGDRGEGVVIERAPGHAPVVRRFTPSNGGSLGGFTNHYTDAGLARDPRNQGVRRATSTLMREERLLELLREHDGRFDPMTVQAVLRDRRGPGGVALPLGHRGALDAWIATHSVIADATERVLWVSTAPHTLGRYERFDLRRIFLGESPDAHDVTYGVLPEDTALTDRTFARFTQARALIAQASACLDRRDARGALALLDTAQRALPEGEAEALRLRARALAALGRRADAAAAWRAVLAALPASPAEREEARAGLAAAGGGAP